VFLGALSMAAWIYGIFQVRSDWAGHFARVALVASLVAVGASTLRFDERPDAVEEHAAAQEPPEAERPGVVDGEIAWVDFDEERIEAELARGRPVFVDFTADWCITCKVNERTALADEDVLESIERHDVVMVRADWTRRQEKIRRVLERHGKAGVPMYLVYRPGAPSHPRVLPEVLTPTIVIEALRRASGEDAEERAEP
jgi:thiol:disulfide interchange protein DsbD